MNRFNQILTAVLAAQLVVAGGIYLQQQPDAAANVQTAIIDTEVDRINRITIVDEDGNQAVLSKNGEQWLLPDFYGLPANAQKVSQALDALASSNSGWPVVTSESGRERFKVEDEGFRKKILLADAEQTLHTLYLGTSPGYRQVHLRRAGEEEVYAVKLDSYALAAEQDSWLDPTLLQTGDDIVGLHGADFSLAKQDGAWRADAGTGEAISEEVEYLEKTVAQIRVNGAADKSPDSFDYELTVDTADRRFTYRFFKDGNEHFLVRDDLAPVFKIGKSDYDDIVGTSATQLVRQASPDGVNPVAGSEENSDGAAVETGETEPLIPNESS